MEILRYDPAREELIDKTTKAVHNAEDELRRIDAEGDNNFVLVACWYKRWYQKTGHKRLGEMLLKFAK